MRGELRIGGTMRHARRTTAALAACATLTLLAACARGTGGTTDATTAFTPDATLGTTLSVMGFGAGDEVASTRFERAEAALDGVKITLSEGELDVQAFLSAVASGNPPDLVNISRDQVGTFASRGAIMPLTACVASEAIATGAFVPDALAQVTFADEVYGIPEFNSVQVVMANADLLDDAGVALTDVDGHDPAAVTAASEALARSKGSRPSVIGFDPKLPEFLPLWVKARGADLRSADGRTAQLDAPEVVDALTWAVGIYDDQGGFAGVKDLRDAADFFGEKNQFATDALGAMPMEQWYVNVLNESSPKAPLAFSTVRTPSGEAVAFASGSAWAVPVGSKNPAAACRFARLMTETDAWLAAAEARVAARKESGNLFTGLLTGNTEADAQIRETFLAGDVPAPWKAAIDATYEANDHTFTLPANPADAEFKAAWTDAVNRVLNGQQKPAEALAQAQTEAQKALDAAWKTWDERSQ